MSSKDIQDKVVVAVATAAVLGVFGYLGGMFTKGTDAANAEQIKEVVTEMLKTDAGETYQARLSEVGIQLGLVEQRVGILTTDLNDLELAVFDLASE